MAHWRLTTSKARTNVPTLAVLLQTRAAVRVVPVFGWGSAGRVNEWEHLTNDWVCNGGGFTTNSVLSINRGTSVNGLQNSAAPARRPSLPSALGGIVTGCQ